MAKYSEASSESCGVAVWTFIIRGGEPFELHLKILQGPPLKHTGGRTIWKMVGTEDQSITVEAILTGSLVGAVVERFTDAESDEEREIRLERIGLIAEI